MIRILKFLIKFIFLPITLLYYSFFKKNISKSWKLFYRICFLLCLFTFVFYPDENNPKIKNNDIILPKSENNKNYNLKWALTDVNIRKTPEIDNGVFFDNIQDQLKQNEKVFTLNEVKNGFEKIYDKNQVDLGWVSSKYLMDEPFTNETKDEKQKYVDKILYPNKKEYFCNTKYLIGQWFNEKGDSIEFFKVKYTTPRRDKIITETGVVWNIRENEGGLIEDRIDEDYLIDYRKGLKYLKIKNDIGDCDKWGESGFDFYFPATQTYPDGKIIIYRGNSIGGKRSIVIENGQAYTHDEYTPHKETYFKK